MAAIFRKSLNIKQLRTDTYKSFESVVCKILSSDGAVLLVNLYRPDYSEKNKFTVKHFLEDFQLFLDVLRLYLLPIIIAGDFNLHLELLSIPDNELTASKRVKKKDAHSFSNLLQLNDFHQVVVGPTHELGGTLDILLMSSCSLPLLHSHSVGLKNEVF